jgi:hypothetical protein
MADITPGGNGACPKCRGYYMTPGGIGHVCRIATVAEPGPGLLAVVRKHGRLKYSPLKRGYLCGCGEPLTGDPGEAHEEHLAGALAAFYAERLLPLRIDLARTVTHPDVGMSPNTATAELVDAARALLAALRVDAPD